MCLNFLNSHHSLNGHRLRHCGGIAKGVRIFPLYSRICKYEFPKRSLYLYWDNFKQSVGLQGFYQFYYTLRDTTGCAYFGESKLTSTSVLAKRSKMAFHLPKIFSQVAQIIFYDREHSKEMFSFLFAWQMKNRDDRSVFWNSKVAESGMYQA